MTMSDMLMAGNIGHAFTSNSRSIAIYRAMTLLLPAPIFDVTARRKCLPMPRLAAKSANISQEFHIHMR